MKWPRRTRPPVPGAGSAWTGFFVGIAASIAANVLHAMEGTWSYPELVGAAFWPTALLISVEILTRVPWPHGWQWIVARFAGLVVVAIVAAALSYLHMRSLLLSWGEGRFQATIGPAAVDGLMLISATALLAISRHRQTTAPAAAATAPAVPVDLVDQIKAAVLADLPRLPELPKLQPLATPAPVRIPLGGVRRTRPRRLAGRRRPAAPALEAAPHHPAPPPPRNVVPADVDGTLVLPSGTTYTPPLEVLRDLPETAAQFVRHESALNGHTRPATTSTIKPSAKKAAPKAKPPRGQLTPAQEEQALQFWRSELAQGREPSARQIGDHIGVSRATGGRLQKSFKGLPS